MRETTPKPRGGGIILLTFILAMALAVFPLPEELRPFRPEWPLLVLLYWVLALPHRIGIGSGWLLGLFVDVLTGSLLGAHALSYALSAYITLQVYRRTRNVPVWQQTLTLGGLLFLAQWLLLMVRNIMGLDTPHTAYWAPVVTGILVWPLLFFILRRMRRVFGVN